MSSDLLNQEGVLAKHLDERGDGEMLAVEFPISILTRNKFNHAEKDCFRATTNYVPNRNEMRYPHTATNGKNRFKNIKKARPSALLVEYTSPKRKPSSVTHSIGVGHI